MIISMRSYLSTHHLWGAQHLAASAAEIEAQHQGRSRFDVRHRAFVMSSIVESVSFLEAAVNEIFQDAWDAHSSYVGHVPERMRERLRAYWRTAGDSASIFSKYQVALGMLEREPLDVGAEPYQSAFLVVKLRNLLVHFKPETTSAAEEQNIVRQLGTKFGENKLMSGSGNPFFPDKCLGAECASWAACSCKTFADQAFRRMEIVPNYQRVRWDEEGNTMKGTF